MSILITSANPLGLRALGSGGRTVIASYEQIARTLRQSLTPEHAALFGEPSARSSTIDWFTEAERGVPVVRLVDAEPALRARGLERLESLVKDIETKAVALQKSDRQDERILGDMLRQALDIPSEDAVFMVGEQPVLTFWGHVRDGGQPAVKPLSSLLARPRPVIPAAELVTPKEKADASAAVADAPVVATGVVEPVRRRGAVVAPIALWIIFTLLLLTCGFELLRGCAIGLPHRLTGWLIDYCPADGVTGGSDALAAERAKQEKLQAEYDDLLRQAALARQSCAIGAGKTIPATPVPRPKPVVTPPQPPPAVTPPQDRMKIPDKPTGKLDFLEGCWRAHEGLTETKDGASTGKKLKITYCFNKDGTGTRTVRYVDDGAQCRGPVRASLDGEKLTFVLAEAPCEGGHGQFSPATDTCRRGEEGVARCDEKSQPDGDVNFTDFPFTRTTEPP